MNVYCNWEKKFAFVEFRSVEETSNSLALDGIMYDGFAIRIRRPSDYNPTAAVGQGPANPSPALNLAAIGMASTWRDVVLCRWCRCTCGRGDVLLKHVHRGGCVELWVNCVPVRGLGV